MKPAVVLRSVSETIKSSPFTNSAVRLTLLDPFDCLDLNLMDAAKGQNIAPNTFSSHLILALSHQMP